MKVLEKISNENARKELRLFLKIGIIICLVAPFAFGWIAIVGPAAGARVLLLTYHKANAKNKKLGQIRAAGVTIIVVSLIELIGYFAR